MLLPDLIDAEKTLARFPGWSEPEQETDYMWFDAPIEIGGFVEAGLVLHGGCFAHQRDRHVVFEVKGFVPGSARRKALARAEWRSLTGGHSNPRRSGLASAGKRVGATHFHPFGLNWSDAEGRMRRGNLRQALDIQEELQTFESFRDHVGILFRVRTHKRDSQRQRDVIHLPPSRRDGDGGFLLVFG